MEFQVEVVNLNLTLYVTKDAVLVINMMKMPHLLRNIIAYRVNHLIIPWVTYALVNAL